MTQPKRNIITLLLFQFAALTMFAQTPDKAKHDSYMSALEANNKFMGTVSISQNGKTVYSRSIGFADTDKKQKLDENSKFRIGSITKMFTSALTFKTIEDHKLALSDRLS